jgi:hypothetical protein
MRGAMKGPLTLAVFAVALFALFRSKARLAPMAVLAASALVGLVAHALAR